jgi:endoglucanase
MHIKKLTITLISLLFAVTMAENTITPVQKHGHLNVKGIHIIDKTGNPTQLRGMSFFWSQWMGRFYNKKVVNWLVDDWKVTIVRAAMGVKHEESESGYLYDGSEKDKVKLIIEAAIDKGIYVIIDWHDHFAFKNTKESVRFFQVMARTYGKYPNIIYEIFNEPKEVSWIDVVKPYSQTVVNAIRAIDPDNIIIIGTPFWCQNVNDAADSPLEGKNLVYGLHFYAATHGEDIRDKAQYAINKGIPLFVSEFGTCLASGDGTIDSAETDRWFSFMDKYSISWCNWSVADKNETASIIVPGARYYGRWTAKELTTSGKIIRRKLRMYAGIQEDDMPIVNKREKKSKIRINGLN